MTPIQLANAYATFANGGTRYEPKLGLRVTRPKSLTERPGDIGNVRVLETFEPEIAGTLTFPSPDQYAVVYQGLQGVAQAGNGTAASAFDSFPNAWPAVAGKTGTAQVDGQADSSLFVGFGPATGFQPAEYAIAAVIPQAGFGADAAAPLVASLLQALSLGQVPPAEPRA